MASAEDRVRDAAAHLVTGIVGSGEGTVSADRPSKTSDLTYTLKRNSTTSPSAMT